MNKDYSSQGSHAIRSDAVSRHSLPKGTGTADMLGVPAVRGRDGNRDYGAPYTFVR